jgi:hypothetical protein
MHCYRGLRSANPEARFSRSVLARENPFSRPIVAETEFVITLDGHFSYYLPGPLLAKRTWRDVRHESAFRGKAEVRLGGRQVSFWRIEAR